MKNRQVLFVTEKWCDGKPGMGLTNSYHNLFGSLISTGLPLDNLGLLHFDEHALFGVHIDAVLKDKVKEFQPNIIFVTFLGDSPLNPSVSVLKEIVQDGYKLCVIWPDGGYEWVARKIKELEGVTTLNVFWAGEFIDYPDSIWLWTPEDPRLYFPDIQLEGVSFIGSLNGYRDRNEYLIYASEIGTGIKITGGQREAKLSAKDYAEQIRTTKINLNFPESPSGKDQFKGRVLEALASRTCLLERKNFPTTLYFDPGKDYIEFTTKEDMCDKINYYLKNDRERLEIAKNGYTTYQNKYSAKKFWETVFGELDAATND